MKGFQTTPTLGGGGTEVHSQFSLLRSTFRVSQISKRLKWAFFLIKIKTRCSIYLVIKCGVHTIAFLLCSPCLPLRLAAGGRLLEMRQKNTVRRWLLLCPLFPLSAGFRQSEVFRKDNAISFSPSWPEERKETTKGRKRKRCSNSGALAPTGNGKWEALESTVFGVCFFPPPCSSHHVVLANYYFLCCVIKKK